MNECPICGNECEWIYLSDNEVVGCDVCLAREDSYNYWQEKRIDEDACRIDALLDEQFERSAGL